MRPATSGPARRYFTDGGRLYRFVEWVVRPIAVVEDCGSLEILVVRREQLNAWREIRPAAITQNA
jgi:hypothetical protein